MKADPGGVGEQLQRGYNSRNRNSKSSCPPFSPCVWRASRRIKIAGLCGVVAPVVALSSIFLAILLSPWFSWQRNALSNLGVSGTAAAVFNSGLIVSGLLAMVFASGLFEKFSGGVLGRLGAMVLFLASIALFGVGLFPETAGPIHFYFSVAFFALFPVSLLLIGTYMIMVKSERKLGYISILMAVLAALPWMFLWNGVAIPEMASATVASAWVTPMGLKLYRGSLSYRP